MYDRLFIDQALSITKTEGLFHNPFLIPMHTIYWWVYLQGEWIITFNKLRGNTCITLHGTCIHISSNKNIKLPVNIPPIIAHTPVKKCMKDLKKVKNNYKTLIVSRFFVT